MKILSPRVLRGLERLNAAYPWDHNARFHGWILRQLPERFDRALDVGSGAGDLARLLGRRAEDVLGVDSDPRIVARARHVTPPDAPVAFSVADAMTDAPAGPFDVITCVATIHHLPFTEALTGFRSLLAPGGSLVVVGLSRAESRTDHVLGLLSIPLNPALGWLKNGGRRSPRPLSMTAPTREADMTFDDLARQARAPARRATAPAAILALHARLAQPVRTAGSETPHGCVSRRGVLNCLRVQGSHARTVRGERRRDPESEGSKTASSTFVRALPCSTFSGGKRALRSRRTASCREGIPEGT